MTEAEQLLAELIGAIMEERIAIVFRRDPADACNRTDAVLQRASAYVADRLAQAQFRRGPPS